MSMQTYTGTLTIVECAGCHMDFGITPQFEAARREDHETFYCPAGHGQVYAGKSEADKLREQLERSERNRRWAEAQQIALADQLGASERSRRAQKGVTTRIKNRIAAGVCPCCNRSFQDLRRHMSGQHPDFANQED